MKKFLLLLIFVFSLNIYSDVFLQFFKDGQPTIYKTDFELKANHQENANF